MRTGTFRALFYFYRQYQLLLLTLTAVCCVVYRANECDVVAAIMCKVITDVLVWYFICSLHRRRLVYYYNLHVSKEVLFAGLFLTDILPFSAALWITRLL